MYLSEISGIKPTSRTFKPSDKLVLPDVVVGIEIEVEGVQEGINLNREFWTVKDDGSLRNNGRELVSTTLFGQDVIIALKEAQVEMERVGAVITGRCGLHIHMDVSGFTTDNLLSLACAVALAEGVLYNYVGNERRDNIYCLPFCGTSNIVPYLNSIKYGDTSYAILSAIKETTKYSGFNILPVLTQGSVEFRHHKGTFNADKIIKWINMLMQLRVAAMDNRAVDLVNINPLVLKGILFGQYSSELTNYDGYDDDMLEGYMVAKDILNFNKLDEVWNQINDLYLDESRLDKEYI